MAVSQVERLKNPCRVWTWNNLVASQPPSSAPATPIRQVRTSPCDLLPGISILASRPAPRPRTIHAMMPITDSSVSDENDMRGSRSCATESRWEKETPEGSCPFLGRCALPAPTRIRKLQILHCSPILGCSCRDPERYFYYTSPAALAST